MARLFSIPICFNGQDHTALVNISNQGCDLVCQVRYLDKGLQHVLSAERLVFGLMDGLKQPKMLPDPMAERLVHNTTEAISRYLQVKEIVF